MLVQSGRLLLSNGASTRFRATCAFFAARQTDAKGFTIRERVPQEPLKACVICLPGSNVRSKRNGKHALSTTQPTLLREEKRIHSHLKRKMLFELRIPCVGMTGDFLPGFPL